MKASILHSFKQKEGGRGFHYGHCTSQSRPIENLWYTFYEAFLQFFPLIKQYAGDERNFVKKAVNWALRQIGKRNSHLLALAMECAYEIQNMDSKTARWVARDALKELQAKEIKD
jgi:3-methyladenine DNA glycosylase AlkD